MTDKRLKQLSLLPEAPATADEPMSVCSIVEANGGNSLSGQQRLEATEDVYAALHAFCVNCIAVNVAEHGEKLGWAKAARDVLSFVARLDPNFRPKVWIDMDAHYPNAKEWGVFSGDWLFWLLMAEHQDELMELAARESGHGRDTDYSEEP